MTSYRQKIKVEFDAMRHLTANVVRELGKNIRGLAFSCGVLFVLLWRVSIWFGFVTVVIVLWSLLLSMQPVSFFIHGVRRLWQKIRMNSARSM